MNLTNERNHTNRFVLLLSIGLFLLFIWYLGLYRPIQQRILAADTTALESQIAAEQLHAEQIQTMQNEIQINRAAGMPIVPSYNHFKQEAEELNRIFSRAYRYEFHFSEPEFYHPIIRRKVSVSYQAETYELAVSLLRELAEGPYRNTIQNISISSSASAQAESADNIKDGAVSVSFQLIYYETIYDAWTEEGLSES